jgi:histone H3/H4
MDMNNDDISNNNTLEIHISDDDGLLYDGEFFVDYFDNVGYEREDDNLIYEMDSDDGILQTKIDDDIRLSQPSIIRLARRAGITSISTDALETIQDIMKIKLNNIISHSVVIRDERNVKILSVADVKVAIGLTDSNIIYKN